jgi:hypothetical protein
LLELLVTVELLCTVELLETSFESLPTLADDAGKLTVEELETCESPVLLPGLVEESSPQADRMHAAAMQ